MRGSQSCKQFISKFKEAIIIAIALTQISLLIYIVIQARLTFEHSLNYAQEQSFSYCYGKENYRDFIENNDLIFIISLLLIGIIGIVKTYIMYIRLKRQISLNNCYQYQILLWGQNNLYTLCIFLTVGELLINCDQKCIASSISYDLYKQLLDSYLLPYCLMYIILHKAFRQLNCKDYNCKDFKKDIYYGMLFSTFCQSIQNTMLMMFSITYSNIYMKIIVYILIFSLILSTAYHLFYSSRRIKEQLDQQNIQETLLSSRGLINSETQPELDQSQQGVQKMQ